MVNDGKFSEIDEESTSAEESVYFGDLTKVEQALDMTRKVLPLRPGLLVVWLPKNIFFCFSELGALLT